MANSDNAGDFSGDCASVGWSVPSSTEQQIGTNLISSSIAD